MAIPTYQQFMLPLLRYAADNQEHLVSDAYDQMAAVFNVTEQQRRELQPSGKDEIFSNRMRWALLYLKKAGLLESTRWSFFKITKAGLQALEQNPPQIDVQFLRRYPSFVEFEQQKAKRKDESQIVPKLDVQTPDESLEYAYQELRSNLAQELLIKVKGVSPRFFERLVVDLLVKMGYGGSIKDAGEAVGKTSDGGIDGIIKEDILGLGVLYIQAKRWEGVVGSPEIHKFVGALHGKHARRGVFITTSTFSHEALKYASGIDDKVVLVDGDELAHLMIDNNVGVSKVANYEIKKVDSDYFSEE
ncbi:MAG: restriction endonuclease [Halobacteriota archaeon]